MKTVLKFFLFFVIFTPHIILAQEEPCFVCDGNSVRGYKSSALGFGNTVEGNYSSVFGLNSRTSGLCSNVFGSDNRATGECSFVAGRNSSSLQNFSAVIGSWSIADGLHSFVIGSQSEANEDFGYVFGSNSKVQNTYSLVVGHFLETMAGNVFIIGEGLLNNPLTCDKQHSLTVGFNSNLPTLFVGTSNGLNTTGKVGIGNVTDPQAKLHIRADAADDATLRLEPGTGKVSRIYFSNTNDYYVQAANDQNMIFRTPADRNFNFKNGNIGVDADNPVAKLQVKNGDIFIEDIDRGIIMKSPDGNCWRGTLDNTGSLHFVQVNCDDLVTGQLKPQSEIESQVRIYPNPAGDKVFVSIDPSLSGARLEITDVSGKMIHSEILVNPESYMDMTSLKSGMYVFKITNNAENPIVSTKIIKQ